MPSITRGPDHVSQPRVTVLIVEIVPYEGVLYRAVCCLMSTLGFADALSQDGVKYLAASPEMMLAPGTPTSVAGDIANHIDDPAAMAAAIVKDTMSTKYGIEGMSYKPAAAMDVLDLSPDKIGAMRDAVKTLDHALVGEVRKSDSAQSAVLDARCYDASAAPVGSAVRFARTSASNDRSVFVCRRVKPSSDAMLIADA
jgi:hypothetical protein